MDAKTLKALNASIAKWDKIAKSGDAGSDIWTGSCPLCALFFDANPADECVGCPVRMATGFRECARTPWKRVSEARDALLFGHPGGLEEFRAAAAKEALFLRALRPIGA